jgi:predicted site-specific integrase-resolvase
MSWSVPRRRVFANARTVFPSPGRACRHEEQGEGHALRDQTLRAAIYARASSDVQSAASIDDQLRICAEWAAKLGLLVVGSYTDQAISGASLIRASVQKLLQDAAAGKIDIILTESLDRVSRDQEDIAHIFKRRRFLGVRIITLSEGEVDELHNASTRVVVSQHLPDPERRDPDRGTRVRAAPGAPGADVPPKRNRLDPEPPAGWDALVALARLLGRHAAEDHVRSQRG